MKTIPLIITAQAPLAINERKPGSTQYQERLDYIPGGVLRGAVAAGLLQRCPHPDCQSRHADCPTDTPETRFCQALFADQVIFHNAYPAWGGAPRVLPATAVSCKDDKGFRGRGHGVFDTLVDRLCWETLQPAGLLYLPTCPACGGRLKSYGGVYTVLQPDDARFARLLPAQNIDAGRAALAGVYHPEQVGDQLLMRVALNRRRGVAEDQLLYAVRALSDQMPDPTAPPEAPRRDRLIPIVYRGRVQILTDVEPPADLWTHIGWLGGGTSRGLGAIAVQVDDSHWADKPLAGRMSDLQAKIADRWQPYAQLAGPPDRQPQGHYFTLDLQADAILREDDWRPTMVLTAEMLRAEIHRLPGGQDFHDDTLELVRSYAAYDYRGGWQTAWGLPKEVEPVAVRGSVYLFRTAQIESWLTPLARLETYGIGARRVEGFGQVRVSDEFHLVLREEAR